MRRFVCILLTALLLTILLCACSDASEETEAPVLWIVSESEGGALSLRTQPYTGADTVPAVMAALLAEFPTEVYLRGWEQRGNAVQLALSESYGDLTGLDLTLANYCITLTLTQLQGVESVIIAVDGRPGQQILHREDVVLSGAEEQPVELTAALCFRRAGGNELGVELRMFRLIESESATLAVLQALLAGPNEAGLTAILPPELTVHSARVEGGVCYADFSGLLLEQIPESAEEQTLVVRSVVESLCSLGHVQAVQLLVDGEPLTQYGQIDVSQPLNPESLMVQE